MSVALPSTLDEAVEALGAAPGAQLLAGGTDFCVEVNFGLRQPAGVVCLRRVGELRDCRVTGSEVTVGAGVTYTDMLERLGEAMPALAAASRTVGSPQIRNAGTLGGNIATASPAGDTLPVLAAAGAEVRLRGRHGLRTAPIADVVTGVKRTSIAPDEVIVDVHMPRVRGPQQFLKVGTRNAMVIAIASAAVVVDLDRRTLRCALGSVGTVPVRVHRAEELISHEIDWKRARVRASAIDAAAKVAAGECTPISDHRGTAEYRRKAVQVVVARGLRRCLSVAD